MKYLVRGVAFSFVIASVVFLNGCMSPANLRKENAASIIKLSIDMTKKQVLEIMGNKSASQDQITITNPYKIDMKYRTGVTYEILYFYTQKNRVSPPFAFSVKEDDLTPVFFVNDKLVGWGASFLPEDKSL